MVTGIAAGLTVPLTAKIRIFPELERTLAYARMLERSGVQLLAVHGRTREQKDARAHKADWDAIKVVNDNDKDELKRPSHLCAAGVRAAAAANGLKACAIRSKNGGRLCVLAGLGLGLAPGAMQAGAGVAAASCRLDLCFNTPAATAPSAGIC